MSTRLLNELQLRETFFHTALDDLESFLWVLIWGIVHASKDIDGADASNEAIQPMLRAWSGDAQINSAKLSIASRLWTDTVFQNLIDEWLDIFARVDYETRSVVRHLPTIPPDNQEGSKWRIGCDWLESHCMKTYEAVLKSGFKHLEDVRKYSDWTVVVAAR
jgi:hypothetical protein